MKATVRKTRNTAKAANVKSATAQKPSAAGGNANAKAKPAEKKMTLKEREALKDSIIAKAKRDAEAAKAKARK